ncbi:hypothetical protein ACFYZ9_25985 [Streptomyces sp. NPDC001691]|uniref:hypothetical protein n=1 Tax=unclassified Streptomyces TaxID=2593676 RepID=UPI0011C04073|nr:hypothetical protein [Streptomyces sp. SDr-06]
MAPRPLRLRTARAVGAALAVTTVLTVNGCAAKGGSRTPGPSGAAPPAASSLSASTVTLDEHDRGRVVPVRAGARVLVRLHSTYWSAPTSSDTGTLAPVGTSRGTPAGNCEPGAGCGSVAADFTARGAGTARIVSHRDSCGEAMRCPPGQGDYAVTIKVA